MTQPTGQKHQRGKKYFLEELVRKPTRKYAVPGVVLLCNHNTINFSVAEKESSTEMQNSLGLASSPRQQDKGNGLKLHHRKFRLDGY